ncbi:MAG: hypothetical protein ACI8SR_001327 [Oceanicoccus sp.]|jgi:uncharacterized protein YjbI with pentapeptide repeats
MVVIMEGTSFITTKLASSLLGRLTKILKNRSDSRNKELININDIFGDCESLAKFYIQPDCQQVNPADEIEDETISSIRAKVFKTINNFFDRKIINKDGGSQMFILADAGMGKTSLMMMLKLSHLMAFWPKEYNCELLKLGSNTLSDISKINNKSKTILLLDSLDEDVQCKQGGTIERLTKILEATTCFYRVIITCRTQFFPETAESAFNTIGKISFNNYECPLIYLSLFTDQQVDKYLQRRYPKRLKFIFNKFVDQKQYDAKQAIKSIDSLQFRPFLLAHVDTLLESHREGATEYDLYKGLVETWLNREVIKLRKYHDREVKRDDLLKACIWLAETMQRQNTYTVALKHITQLCHNKYNIILLDDSADRVVEGIDHIDIGTNSLLNRNSFGEFRFSHLSIREFLIVYGIELGILVDDNDPFNKTDKMLSFIKTVNERKFGLFYNEKKGRLLSSFKITNNNQLKDIDLSYASLDSSILRNALLNGVDMKMANLEGADLQGADLQGVNLQGANLSKANLKGVNLKGANLFEANLNHTIFSMANLKDANLNSVSASYSNFDDVDFRNVKMRDSSLFESSFDNSNFKMAQLSFSDFRNSTCINANFEEADLTKSDFRAANLSDSNLKNAKLEGTRLNITNLSGANITEKQRKIANFEKFDRDKRKKSVQRA